MRRFQVLGMSLLLCVGASCGSVEKELNRTFGDTVGRSRPNEERPASVTIPDLEKRDTEDHFLARIQQLTAEVQTLRAEKEKAEKEAHAARQGAASAQNREEALAQENQQLQNLLRDAERHEKDLTQKLLAIRLENLRLKQKLNEARIRELQGEPGQ
ncbi:MAG TPA: hypothetical protein ENK43_05545 [Planctomycetes bacterium]|nr:hypothetical protein [Planctomycetota bacterium]